MSATIKNAAKPAGLAVPTDSGALNNSAKISEGTKRRVHQAAEELSFRPSETARNIKKRKSETIGLFLNDLGYFYDQARGRIEQQDKLIEDMHADKLNLIGKMASSMAHEIRNPLTSIKGFIVLIRKVLSPNELQSIEKYLDIIDNEFRNIEMQITGFLSFSRKPIADETPELTAINCLIEKTLLLVNPLLLNENIELLAHVEDGLQAHIQKIALIQVFSNLINNAIDALRDSGGRQRLITIRAFADGGHVYVRISNTGPEIPSVIQTSLFDPFVTGKAEGTGLGLAICKQIVERNDGNITFETNSRETTFTLRFPAPPAANLT
ncbi:sensor histidine kinase [Paenibacillus montanisoli]|uniref:histidine kinase n=1 Tax=Paenibacillus montanisoli TaxID=2081970 RepID=A0A328U445_9BACL|nr:HAMP domain-containing sensor histidine kinase [Paenibacillus montanisoli]RAP77578.1 hypothetical protein DL346_03620 [Paenibacillus montanisoli]